MHVIKRLGVALLAVLALSAIAVSSASASPLFLSHSTGKLSAVANGPQKLVTKGGTITCNALKLTEGASTLLRALSLLVIIQYEECTAFKLSATITPVHYRLDANGLVVLEGDVTVSAGFGTCTATIPAAKNKSLNTVKYNNRTDGKLLLLIEVTKVTSSAVGTCAYEEESNGTATGHATASLVAGGVLRWDP
jgi:hypothetical protein